MTADIVHQELNDEQRHEERDRAAEQQNCELERREAEAELNELKSAETEHNGHSKKEGKLSRSNAGDTDYQRADDSCARAGGAGDYRENLKKSYKECVKEGDAAERCHTRLAVLIQRLDDDERRAVEDKHYRYDYGRFKMSVDIVAEKQRSYRARNAGNNDLEPCDENIGFHQRLTLLLVGALKRPHLLPEQKNNGEYRAELNNDEKYVLEFLTLIHMKKLIDEQHMTRRGNGQPFGYTLNDAEKNHLKGFY